MPSTDHTSHSQREAPRLKVLFIGGYDSTNYVYVELIRELQARGHAATVLVEDERDSVNNKMFERAGIDVTRLDAFDVSRVPEFDFAFSGQFVRRPQRAVFSAISRHGVFLVSFANLFSSVTMRVPVDLVITNNEAKFEDFRANGLSYPMVAIGNPQYDPLIRERESWAARHAGRIQEVLVVDQGAYPFGDEGKRQLAEALCGLARHHPDVTFRVKPRYLPDEAGEHLHAVSDHLYAFLDGAPENLVLMREPTVLEEIVTDFDAMVTTWSTAHLDAAALGMPLLLIGGLASCDVFDVRLPRVEAAYEHLSRTGCLHDHADVARGRCEFRPAAPEYVDEEFADATSPCAPRVIELLETIEREAIARGRTVTRRVAAGYGEFLTGVKDGSLTVRGDDPQVATAKAVFGAVNPVVQELVFENRCVGMRYDMSRVAAFWEAPVDLADAETGVSALRAELAKAVDDTKRTLFDERPDLVEGDVFVQDQYFDWLRTSGRVRELLEWPRPVVAPESLEFNRGLVRLRRGRALRAARHFADSFDLSLRKRCRVLRRDKHISVVLSKCDTSPLALAILLTLALHDKNEALAGVEIPRRPGMEALVYQRVRALRRLGRTSEARDVAVEYLALAEGRRGTHGSGARGALLGTVARMHGVLLRALVRTGRAERRTRRAADTAFLALAVVALAVGVGRAAVAGSSFVQSFGVMQERRAAGDAMRVSTALERAGRLSLQQEGFSAWWGGRRLPWFTGDDYGRTLAKRPLDRVLGAILGVAVQRERESQGTVFVKVVMPSDRVRLLGSEDSATFTRVDGSLAVVPMPDPARDFIWISQVPVERRAYDPLLDLQAVEELRSAVTLHRVLPGIFVARPSSPPSGVWVLLAGENAASKTGREFYLVPEESAPRGGEVR